MLEKHIIDQFQPGNTFTESEIEYEVIDYSDIGNRDPPQGAGSAKPMFTLKPIVNLVSVKSLYQ